MVNAYPAMTRSADPPRTGQVAPLILDQTSALKLIWRSVRRIWAR